MPVRATPIRRCPAWQRVLCILAAGAAAVAVGQVMPGAGADAPADSAGPAAGPQTAEPRSGDAVRALHERQYAIRERVQQLEGRMLKLTRLLAESEPDKAERLRDALNQVGEKRVRARLERVVVLLRDAKYDQAEHEQQALTTDLEAIFTLLTDTMNEIDRRRAERERLEAHAKAIQALIDEQTDELHRTRFAEAERQHAAEIARIAEELEKLADQQARLRNEPPAAAEKRTAQAGLEKQARAAAARLGQLEPPTADPQAAQSEQAAAEETAAAADAMRAAADAMDASAERPGGDPQTETAAKQQEAEEKLRRAIQRLRETERELRAKNDLREIERLQRQTQQSAAGRSEQMQQDAQGGKPTPGGPQVGKAAEQMKNAADRLGEDQGAEAEQQQQAALEQLQQALDELDDALRQLRKEEMEETLTALEQRFRSMLAREESVREMIVDLHAVAPDARSRNQLRRIEESAGVQRQVTTDCEATLRILIDEGTTVILPELVRQLAGDMADLAARLEQADVSPAALAAVDDIIAALKEILDVVEQKRADMQDSDEQGEASPQSSNEPLVPGSAELKLLRSSQVRINRRTDALQKATVGPPTPDIQRLFDDLAGRQQQLADLARRMNERS